MCIFCYITAFTAICKAFLTYWKVYKKVIKNPLKSLTGGKICGIIYYVVRGVAQVVARYLGVVEAVGSSPVTPTSFQPSYRLSRTYYFKYALLNR